MKLETIKNKIAEKVFTELSKECLDMDVIQINEEAIRGKETGLLFQLGNSTKICISLLKSCPTIYLFLVNPLPCETRSSFPGVGAS